MAERTSGGSSAPRIRRLQPGEEYFDFDHPERGLFAARGDEEVSPDANIVAKTDLDDSTLARLIGQSWGGREAGEGYLAHDQGAFGDDDSPRSDAINAVPPGVGENLVPPEDPDESRRR